MNKTIPTEQTPDNIGRVLAILAAKPEALAAYAGGRSDGQLRQPLGPGGRSFAETVAHLINTEWRTTESITLALLTDEPLLPAVHAERDYGKLLRHDLMPAAESLAYFRYRRAVLLRLLSSLTEAQWARAVREESKQRRESIYRLARGMALHERTHLANLAVESREV